MKTRTLAAAFALAAIATPVAAADDAVLTRLTLCQDSWYDSKSDAAKMKMLGGHFRAAFKPHGNDPYMVPVKGVTVLGFKVEQAYPDSVGMGVGFSLLVTAPYDKAKKAMETALAKKLKHCEASDGMKSCDFQIAEKRTAMLMTADSEPKHTLIGCYYFYEK